MALKNTSIIDSSETFQILFNNIETLSLFLQKNCNEGFEDINNLDINLFSMHGFYKADLKQKNKISNTRQTRKEEKEMFLHFLVDAYLYQSKGTMPVDGILTFSTNPQCRQNKSSRFHIPKSFQADIVNKRRNPFLNEIHFERNVGKFIISFVCAPILFLYDNMDSFKKIILRLNEQNAFKVMAAGIITSFQVIHLAPFDFSKLRIPHSNLHQLPHERSNAYRFIAHLTDAMIEKEFKGVREIHGFYLHRWLKLRILLSLSSYELDQSLRAYLSLLLSPDEKWLWKFIDVESEIIELLKNTELKKKILLELLDLKEQLLAWVGKRYSIRLNRIILR